MNLSFNYKKELIGIGVPLFMVLGLALLGGSSLFLTNPDRIAFGITFDYLITIPLFYFLLISRTSIPKLTVGLIISGNLLIAGYVIPAGYQCYPSHAKAYLLPIVEGSVVVIILTKLIRRIFEKRKEQTDVDLFSVLNSACEEVLPRKLSALFATEVAVVYYGFIHWKKTRPGSDEFTCHRESGITVILMAVLFLIALETSIVHLVVARWNETLAWLLTAMGVYTAVQLFGFLKSISKRYCVIENGKLHLRYGILCETCIDLKDIQSVEAVPICSEIASIRRFSPFGKLEGYNVVIELQTPTVMTRPYGRRVSFQSLAIFIDNREEFIRQLKNYCGQEPRG